MKPIISFSEFLPVSSAQIIRRGKERARVTFPRLSSIVTAVLVAAAWTWTDVSTEAASWSSWSSSSSLVLRECASFVATRSSATGGASERRGRRISSRETCPRPPTLLPTWKEAALHVSFSSSSSSSSINSNETSTDGDGALSKVDNNSKNDDQDEEVKALLNEIAQLDKQREQLLGWTLQSPSSSLSSSSSPSSSSSSSSYAAKDNGITRQDEQALQRTAAHLDKLRRMEQIRRGWILDDSGDDDDDDDDDSNTRKDADTTNNNDDDNKSSRDPHAGERKALYEEFRFRPANDLKRELTSLKLQNSGRKPDLAWRLANYHVDYKYAATQKQPRPGNKQKQQQQQQQQQVYEDNDGVNYDAEEEEEEMITPSLTTTTTTMKEDQDKAIQSSSSSSFTSFAGLYNLSPIASTALTKAKFTQPTRIQKAAIPRIASGDDCILHAETGSGKTLAYLLPITEQLWSDRLLGSDHDDDDDNGDEAINNKPGRRRRRQTATRTRSRGGYYGLILTPTRELAAQVAGVATVLAPPGSVRLLSRPCNLIKPNQNERSELPHGGRPSDGEGGGANGRYKPRLLVGSAKSVMISLYGDGKMPGAPTSKPEAQSFLRRIRWLVLDEVDRLLHVKTSRTQKAYKRHEKPAAIVASAITRMTLGKAQIVAASATVGRPLRRELARVLGLPPQECPPVIRGGTDLVSGQNDDDENFDDHDDYAGDDDGEWSPSSSSSRGTDERKKRQQPQQQQQSPPSGKHVGRAVTIPPTVRNYVVPVEVSSSGSLLAKAAFITKALPRMGEGGSRKVLFVLTRGCGINVRNTIGALRHFRVQPAPQSLLDALEASGTDRLIEVHRKVSGATGVGESAATTTCGGDDDDDDEIRKDNDDERGTTPMGGGGYVLVTGEDSLRGLHLDGLDSVVVVGRPHGPDEYTHIAGRTGRAGRTGNVINVVSYEQAAALTSWERMLNVDFIPMDIDEVSTIE